MIAVLCAGIGRITQEKIISADAYAPGIQESLEAVADISEAKLYLEKNLIKLRGMAGSALNAAGVDEGMVTALIRVHCDNWFSRILPSFVLGINIPC